MLALQNREIPGALGYPSVPFYVLTGHESMTKIISLWLIVRRCEHFVIITSVITLVESVCNDLMAICARSK